MSANQNFMHVYDTQIMVFGGKGSMSLSVDSGKYTVGKIENRS